MSKRVNKFKKMLDKAKTYTLDESLSFLRDQYLPECSAKFNETVDFVIKLGIDTKQSDQMVRGVVGVPHGLGKKRRIALIIEPSRMKEAEESGADEFGDDTLIEKIKDGFLDFDVCVSTPGMMSKVSAIGRLLGPKGLMPNPKLGTVSDDIKTTVQGIKNGQVEFRADKSGIIHAGVAKINFEKEKIKANVMALYSAVLSAKPAKSKGLYIRGLFLSTTHGPSIKLDLKSLVL